MLRGILIIILGILAFAWPGITLEVLMIFFGAFVLVDGIFAIVASVKTRHRLWGLTLAGGLAGIVVGILVFMAPLIAGLVMFYLIAAWLIIAGIVRVASAIRRRKEMPLGGELALGIISICFGVAIFFIPIAMLLAMLWLIAAFAIVIGIFLLVGAVQVQRSSKATS